MGLRERGDRRSVADHDRDDVQHSREQGSDVNAVFEPGDARVQKGVKLLQETKDITQFFNRDSSDALQTTADAALNKFIDEPNNVDSILKDWQAAASKVFQS